jgi:hypothetical protein
LREFIETKFDLPHALLSCGVLTHEQMRSVRATKEEYERVDLLLKYLAETTEAQRVDVCRALRLTGQQHVTNFIDMAVGQNAAADYGDNLTLDKHRSDIIDTNGYELAELIQVKYEGFLDMIYACKCITKQQKDYLNNLPPSAASNNELLAILRRRSIADYKSFVACLANSGQLHVANVLKYGGATAEMNMRTVDLTKKFSVLLTSLARGFRLLGPAGRGATHTPRLIGQSQCLHGLSDKN